MRRQHFTSLFISGVLAIGGCVTSYESSRWSPDAAESKPDLVTTRSLDSAPAPAEASAGSKVAAPTEAQPSPSATLPSLQAALRDVRDARDADAAVDAYARGVAVDPTNLALHKAYVRKVVDLDVPQLGAAAADRVLAVEPNHGLSRGVLAFTEAKQGQMVDALTNITLAVKRAKDEPLVQRTAAHLFAWFDNTRNPPTLPQGLRRSIEDAHSALLVSATFTDAYREASDYYHEEQRLADAGPRVRPATNPTTRPTTGPVASTQDYPEPSGNVPDYGGYTGSDVGYAPYTPAPYQPYAGNYYDSGYPYGYGYAPYCWGTGFGFATGFAFFDTFEFGRHHRHHDRDNDHDADDRFRDRFFGSSHRLGTATGEHLRELQRAINAHPPVAAHHAQNSADSTITQITPAHPRSSSERFDYNPGRGGNGGAIYGRPGYIQRDSGSTSSHGSSPAPASPSYRTRGSDHSSAPGPAPAAAAHSSPAPSQSHSSGGGGGGSSSGGGGSSHSSGSSSSSSSSNSSGSSGGGGSSGARVHH